MPSDGPVVLFDGVCNLCNGWVDFLIRRDPTGSLRFAPIQSAAARDLLSRVRGVRDADVALSGATPDTILLVEAGRLYDRSTAVLRVLRHLRAPWPALAALRVIPRPVRDGVYRWVAAHRYRWFGRAAACRVPTPEIRDRFLADPYSLN